MGCTTPTGWQRFCQYPYRPRECVAACCFNSFNSFNSFTCSLHFPCAISICSHSRLTQIFSEVWELGIASILRWAVRTPISGVFNLFGPRAIFRATRRAASQNLFLRNQPHSEIFGLASHRLSRRNEHYFSYRKSITNYRSTKRNP